MSVRHQRWTLTSYICPTLTLTTFLSCSHDENSFKKQKQKTRIRNNIEDNNIDSLNQFQNQESESITKNSESKSPYLFVAEISHPHMQIHSLPAGGAFKVGEIEVSPVTAVTQHSAPLTNAALSGINIHAR